MSLSPRGGRRAPVYQIDFTAVAAGKRIASTKRRVRWRFGFANPDALASGETGTACRGEEHDITIVWSLTSGKRMILADGQEVHYANSRNNMFEYSWTMKGNHVLKVIAHASPPLSPTPGFRQYDFFVNGQSFFSFPKVFRVGLAPNDPRARAPGTAQMAEASHRYTPGTVGRRSGSSTGIVSLEAPGNIDEEEAYLQEAIRQSLQDDEKPAADSKAAPAASTDLLDFGTPAPGGAQPGAMVPAPSSDPFGFSAGGPPGHAGSGALVAAAPSSGYGGYAPAPNQFAPGANPYGAPSPAAANPYGAPLANGGANPYGAAPTQDPANPYGAQAPAPANPYAAPAPANPYEPAPANPYAAGTPAPATNPYGTAPAPTNTFPGAPAAPAPPGGNMYGNATPPANPYATAPAPTQPTSNGFPNDPSAGANLFAAPGPATTPGPTSTNPYGAVNGSGSNVPPAIAPTPRGQQTPSTLGFGSPPAELGFTPAPQKPAVVNEVPNNAPPETTNGGGSKVDQVYAKLANLDSFSLVSKKDEEKTNPFETMSVGGTRSLADLQKEKPKPSVEVMKTHGPQAVVVSSNQNGYASQYGMQQPYGGGGGAMQQQPFGAPAPGGQQFQQQQPPQPQQPPMQQQQYGQQPMYGQQQPPQQPQSQPQYGQQSFAPQYGQPGAQQAPPQQQPYGQPFGGGQPQQQQGGYY